MGTIRPSSSVEGASWGPAILWGAVSLVVYAAAGLLALTALGIAEQTAVGEIGTAVVGTPWEHGLALGAWPLLWGSALALTLPRIGRIIVGPQRSATVLTWALMTAGLVVAAAVQIALFGWALERFGAYEPAALGATNLLSPALVATSLAFLASRTARAEARTIARLALAASAAVSGAIVLLNVPGIRDGIRPESMALAATMVGATAFVICVCLVAFAVPRARPRSAAERPSVPGSDARP